MSAVRRERPSDSPFVERITHVRYDSAVRDVTTPDGCWDIVVQRHGGKLFILQTGVITRPVLLPYDAGDEYLSISFKPGVFMPKLPGNEMLDKGLPRPIASKVGFYLERDRFEIPNFENAEGLVERLTRNEIIVRDELVEGVAEGRPKAASPRSVQRHFLRALGITPNQLAQLRRAGEAARLLAGGKPVVEVAVELGYSDQSHMTRSLKRIMGRTPGEIARTAPR